MADRTNYIYSPTLNHLVVSGFTSQMVVFNTENGMKKENKIHYKWNEDNLRYECRVEETTYFYNEVPRNGILSALSTYKNRRRWLIIKDKVDRVISTRLWLPQEVAYLAHKYEIQGIAYCFTNVNTHSQKMIMQILDEHDIGEEIKQAIHLKLEGGRIYNE